VLVPTSSAPCLLPEPPRREQSPGPPSRCAHLLSCGSPYTT
jgi:hypothetical protein